MKNKLVVTVIFLSALLGACSTGRIAGIKPVDTITQSVSGYEEGKQQLKAGNPALAIAAFRKDLSRQGANAWSLNGLALAYQALARPDVAEMYLKQALALAPESPETLYNLSLVKFQNGSFAEAARFADRAQAVAEGAQDGDRELRGAVAGNAARLAAAAAAAWERRALEASLATPPALERAGLSQWTLNLSGRPPVSSAVPERTVEPLPSKRADAPPAAAAPAALKIVNALGRNNMASRMAGYLKTEGVSVNALANAKRYGWVKTEIRFGAGQREAASQIAKLLPVPVKLVETEDTRSEIELHLGGDLLAFDQTLKAA